MKAIIKNAVIGGAGTLLLGASLALSNAGISRASTIPSGHGHPSPSKKSGCDTSGYCLTESNAGSGGGILAESQDLYGLLGISSATSGDGVYGEGNGTEGNGVVGIGGSGAGTGVSGQDTSGVGVSGSGAVGVEGNSSSSSGAGVYGAGASYGVEGSASSSPGAGIYGTGFYGIEGSSSASDGAGVYGTGAQYGVEGYSASGNGAGVYGYGPQAVEGYSASGIAGVFENDNSTIYALIAESDASGGAPFMAEGTAGAFEVDGSGDGLFNGYVLAQGGYKTVIRSRDGENLGASVALTAQATMEDTGTARLLEGESVVRFAADFGSTIDAGRGYQVFLTPNGETRGLYVSAKYEGGFVVRENERGRSSVYFDYRIVAHPHGVSDARLPRVNVALMLAPPPKLDPPQPPQIPKLPQKPKLPQIQRAAP